MGVIVWYVQMSLFLVVIANCQYNNTCYRHREALICDHDLPDLSDMDSGITEVYITDLKLRDLTKRKYIFRHVNWKSVRRLSIHGKPYKHSFYLNDYDLRDLPSLESLSINIKEFYIIGPSAFVGLYNLSYLDFSGCTKLKSRFATQALANKNNTFRLEVLKLDNVGTIEGGVIKVDHVFLNMLYDRAVLHLSIRGDTILLTDSTTKFVSTLPLLNFDASNSVITRILTNDRFNRSNVGTTFKNLKHFNVSKSLFGKTTDTTIISRQATCTLQFFKLETSDISHLKMFPALLGIINVSCLTSLRRLYLNSNVIKTINATIIYPFFMEMMDLSWNRIEWISKTALDGLVVLKTLNLSHNYLFKMKTSSEFNHLFFNLIKMETIYLSNNSFTHLPYNLFMNNGNLKTIILSGNQLQSFDLNISHLHRLEFLDLYKNNIIYIDSFVLQYLQDLIHMQLKTEVNKKHLVIDLQDNKFECNCENYTFIQLVYQKLQPMHRDIYKCHLEDKIVNIDHTVLDRTLFLCYRTNIIIGSTLTGFVFIVIIGMTIFACYRKIKSKRRQRVKNHFLYQLIRGQSDQKYLTFISFSSADFQICIKSVEPALKIHMLQRFNIPEQFTITGDSNFNVGFPILNEIMRCIKASCVIVCIVSQSYCDSQWCQTELREAVEQGKPVILLFLEEVKRQHMPDILRTLFDRNIRSNLLLKDGKYEPTAGWNNLCESIVSLASGQHNIEGRERKRMERCKAVAKDDEEVTFV